MAFRVREIRVLVALLVAVFFSATLVLHSGGPHHGEASAAHRAFRADMRSSYAGVMVLGMHRSGTSLLTGLLSRSGFWAADHPGELLGSEGAHNDNRKGFYERNDLLHQNDFFLKHQNADWTRFTWRFDPKETLAALSRGDTFLDWWQKERNLWEEGESLMAAVSKERLKPYVLKDPRLCITAPVWLELFGEKLKPAMVLATRSPLEVARSLNKRDNFPTRRGLLLWVQYNRLAVQSSKGHCTVTVDNRELLAAPVEELRRVLYELRDCGVKNIGPEMVDEAEVAEWIDMTLLHDHQEDGCITGPAGEGRNYLNNWDSVRNPENPAEVMSVEPAYDLAMTVYCDLLSGRALDDKYDWEGLFSKIPDIVDKT